MSNDKIEFTLRQARQFANMTMNEAAKELGISIPTLHRWECDKNPKVSFSAILKMVELYKIPIDRLKI